MARGSSVKKKKKASDKLKHISIVLVEPQSPGNIGGVARAMMNTGFSDLVLINPCDYHNDEAYSFACNAIEVLKGARVFPDLDAFLKEVKVVVGTTRRMGRIRYPLFTLSEASPKILELGGSNRVAILFGREDRGLENEEVKLCDILIEIPASEKYPSFNLSQAALLVCYHLFTAEASGTPSVEVAPKEDLERLYAHMESALRALSYGEQGGEYLLKSILRNFRKLFGRTGLLEREVNMLRGIFTQIENRVR